MSDDRTLNEAIDDAAQSLGGTLDNHLDGIRDALWAIASIMAARAKHDGIPLPEGEVKKYFPEIFNSIRK